MVSEAPGRAGTRRGADTQQTARIVRYRTPCENCQTPLYPRETRYCRQCKAWLAIYARTVEIAILMQSVQP